MPASPRHRRSPGQETTKQQRDKSKKDVALNKAEQKRDMAMKAMATKLAAQQKLWSKQRDDAIKLKKALDGVMAKIKEDRTLDQRFLGQIKKFGSELVKLEKQLKVFGKASDNTKTFAEVQVQTGRISNVSKVQTYADLSLFLAAMIVLLNRALKLRMSKKG